MAKSDSMPDFTQDPDRALVTRDVDKLMEMHRGEIDELRVRTKDVLFDEWDDLWLLRYVLSSPDSVEKAEEKVRQAVKFREDNPWLESAREAARMDPPGGHEIDEELFKLMYMCEFHKGAKDGSILVFWRPGISKFAVVSSRFSVNQLRDWSTWYNERNYHILDKRTRESGQLVKVRKRERRGGGTKERAELSDGRVL